MTSCFEVEEDCAALEAMPARLNWGSIFNLPYETCQHTVVALQHLEIYTDGVMGVIKMS